MIIIPFLGAASFSSSIVIDNSAWSLSFKWNTRFQKWRMGISNSSGPVIEGITLVPNLLLLKCHIKDNLPKGDFLIWSPSGTAQKLGRDNLGTGLNYELWYFEPLEVIQHGLI